MMRLALYVDEDKYMYHHHLNMKGLEMTFIDNAPYNLIKTIQKVSPPPPLNIYYKTATPAITLSEKVVRDTRI